MNFKIDNLKIAHISDIHIRFGSRHEEYKIVFNRLIKDLQKEQPRRIVVTGDLFHQKINLSPAALSVASKFLRHLSKIAPVDIFLGNHDLNEQDLSQGNALDPIIDLLVNGVLVTRETKTLPDFSHSEYHGIFFYLDSGFYNIDDDLVYGVYSLWDNEILTLMDKNEEKRYIALYHGPVYGCMSDNGYEMKGDELLRLSTFNNFDIVLLGDIHEYQAFERNGRDDAAYAGSLLQQDVGESLNKGYLMWDIDTCTHKRKIIPNDYGMSKLNISQGEDVWDRLNDLQFSFNPKKTKVYIEIEDYAENENVELKSQIRKYIRSKHGCEFIDIQFVKLQREKVYGVETDKMDLNNSEVFSSILEAHLKAKNDSSINELLPDILQLNKEVEAELKLKPTFINATEWDIEDMTTYNIFSHPAKENYFDFKHLNGIIGIFGKNYSGKSNLIRALVWGLYCEILGDGDSHKVVNLYTGKNNAWVKITINIGGIKFRIFREITVKLTKKGETKAEYGIKFEYQKSDGNWEDSESDRAAKEKPEVKKLILDAIGTFQNFTKVSLQTQGGKDDYLSLKQQPKNDLVREYAGLLPCDLRHEFVNKKFNEVKAVQKKLGDPAELEKQIEEINAKITEEKVAVDLLEKERENNFEQVKLHNEEILNKTKELIKIDEVNDSEGVLKQKIINCDSQISSAESIIEEKQIWLDNNFMKEIPEELKNVNIASLQTEYDSIKSKFLKDKTEYINLEGWLKTNIKKEELSTEGADKKIDDIKTEILSLNDALKISKGEKCPVCQHVSHEANPDEEKRLIAVIAAKQKELLEQQTFIKNQREVILQNNLIDKETNRLESIKNGLSANKLSMDKLKINIERCSKLDDDRKHNTLIVSASDKIKQSRQLIEQTQKQKETFQKQLETLVANEAAIKSNNVINQRIKELKESVQEYDFVNRQIETKLKEAYKRITTNENSIEGLKEKLDQIKLSVKIFKKYSIYLQAVSREGIPAEIISKRLPIINYRIRNILHSIVNFNIELFVNHKGDIQEEFYFNEDKSDRLPLSMASGSQKFIGSVAIRDALHYISCLVKPSFCIIDEGFGTLDDDKTADIKNVFTYLKGKYKHVFIITHKNEIKDCVNHIIQITKSTDGLTKEQIEANPEAGISQFSIT